MRRRPLQHELPHGGGLDLSPPALPLASELGDSIEPFLVGGGQTYWQELERPGDPDPVVVLPQLGGLQLLAAVYVPMGRCAWVKRITVAPTVPSIIGDAFRNHALWTYFNAVPADGLPGDGTRAAAHNGLWETPLAWEGYFDESGEGEVLKPRWEWQITTMPGDWRKVRADLQIGAFDRSDPTTWPLVLDHPVTPGLNFEVNRNVKLYGQPLRGLIGGQRFQVLPRDDFSPHWFVSQNQSVMLWAQWRQEPFDVQAADSNGPSSLESNTYPIGPSVGQLSGYTQSIQTESAIHNAREGWGG